MNKLYTSAFALLLAFRIPSESAEALTLMAGQPLERDLGAGESQDFTLVVDPGQQVRARVTQFGLQLVARLFDAEGQLLKIDGPTASSRDGEEIFLELKMPGRYRLNLSPVADSSPGRYRVEIAEITDNKVVQGWLELQEKERQRAVAWLQKRASPLKTIEPGQDFEDLQPFADLVGNARVVSLGEATHGTHEFFRLRHRLFEFLVERKGFTIFSIETNMSEAYDIDRYVVTGEGDPRSVLAGTYCWTWNTEEILDLVMWMRAYNADPNHKRKLRFYGFDMQYAPRAVKMIRQYLAKVDPAAAAGLSSLRPLALPHFLSDLSIEEKQVLVTDVDALARQMDENRTAYVGRSDPKTWAVIRHQVELLHQNLTLSLSKGDNCVFARDAAMAENLKWILDHEGPRAKMVVWAHNGHVMRKKSHMGGFLQDALGKDLRTFGFAFNQGGFQAVKRSFTGPHPGLQGLSVAPARKDSLDAVLAETGQKLALFNFHDRPATSDGSTWFDKPRASRQIGAVMFEGRSLYSEEKAWETYDGLFFVESTTRARPLEDYRVPPEPAPLAKPTNLDFDLGKPGEWPAPWRIVGRSDRYGYRAEISTARTQFGSCCLHLYRQPDVHIGELGCNFLQIIDAAPLRGQRLRFSASARFQQDEADDQAHLFMLISGPSSRLKTRSKRLAERSSWQDYELELEIPPEATSLTIGLHYTGNGDVWLDHLRLEEVTWQARLAP